MIGLVLDVRSVCDITMLLNTCSNFIVEEMRQYFIISHKRKALGSVDKVNAAYVIWIFSLIFVMILLKSIGNSNESTSRISVDFLKP